MDKLLGEAGLLLVLAIALIGAAVPQPLVARLALALASAVAGAIAWRLGHSVPAALAVAAAGTALFQAVLIAIRGRRLRFNAEEERMAQSVLATLDRRQQRHLIDQGLWVEGRTGEELTREGEPVGNLFYLAEGTAAVTSHGMWIATATAPTLVGEMTVLDESGATATVALDAPARMWCIASADLRRFLKENPDIRRALENSFFGSLIEKLRASNKAMVERAAA